MAKCFLLMAALSGFASVGLGAFGAHALKSIFTEYSMGVFKTGVEYQFLHTFALALVGLLYEKYTHPAMLVSGWAFCAGIFLFSGSLYLLAFTGHKFWGAVTPFGGVSFLTGWLLLALSIGKGVAA